MNERVPDTRSLDPSIPGFSPSPLGIGLVGLGHWGRNYARTLLALPECRLVAAADADAAARARMAGETDIAVRESADELLSDPAIKAVVIATPDRTHFSLASAALAAGRDVLVEKPMTLVVSEAETLVRQAEDRRLLLAVGHTAVYSTDFESLRTRLDALPEAAPRQVVAERTSSGPSAGQSPIADRQSSILFDLCPHDIALAVLLFGNPVAARARSSEDGVRYEVRFQNDALLRGRAQWCKPPHLRRFEVASQRGKEKVESGNCQDRTSEFPLSNSPLSTSPLGRQCLDFIGSCRTRREPLNNGRLGLAVIRCIATLVASCADGRAWVPLSSKLRTPHCQTGAVEANAERRSRSGRAATTPDLGLRPSEFGIRT